uniref:Uncharacterized protein n=1 Tax=Oryza sativa subsp. japonica TaxID=39947 RepID=Q6K759_ORYSJ|nr:hypothetical protein [Oryza sativa Japonica Group]
MGASGCHVIPLGLSGRATPRPSHGHHVARRAGGDWAGGSAPTSRPVSGGMGAGGMTGMSPVSGGGRRWAPPKDAQPPCFRLKARMAV